MSASLTLVFPETSIGIKAVSRAVIELTSATGLADVTETYDVH